MFVRARLLVPLALGAALVSGCSYLPGGDELVESPPASVLAKVEFPEIDGKVVVGAVFDLSNNRSADEAAFADQAVSAVTAVNASGGLLGDPLGLQVLDSANDVDIAIDAVETLIARNAKVILMGCEPETVIPAAALASEKGVVVLSPCITDERFGADTGPLAFSFAPTDRQQGIVLSDHAASLGFERVIVVASASDEGSFGRCSSFAERFAASGGAIAATIEYAEQGLSVAEVPAAVAQFVPPDALIVCAPAADLPEVLAGIRPSPTTAEEPSSDTNATTGPPIPVLMGSEGDTMFWMESQPSLTNAWIISSTSLFGSRSAAETEIIRALTPPPRGSADLLVTTALTSFVRAASIAGTAEGVEVAAVLRAGIDDALLVAAGGFVPSPTGPDGAMMFSPTGLGMVQVQNGFPSLITVRDPAASPVLVSPAE